MIPTSRAQWAALCVAFAVLAGVVGYAVGQRESTPSRDSIEAGFLFDMIGHHEQALQLSLMEIRNGSTPEVQHFAHEILREQAFEIGVMTQRLEDWGFSREEAPTRAMDWMGQGVALDAMPGLASDDEITALGVARGPDADALFVRLMQDHHEGGVHMADFAAKRSSSAFIRQLAARMAKVQRQEITEMERARAKAGLAEKPAAWTPDEVTHASDDESGDDTHDHG